MDGYHIYDEIGRGVDSIVYKGREKQAIRFLAIKSVDKGHIEKVLQEVRVQHRLRHPNCLRFFKWYETRRHIWLILEYASGGSLKDLISRDDCVPETALRIFGADVVHGLQYLHSNGVLYCDLKPSNVLMNEYGVLKLSDFALAITLDQLSAQPPEERKKQGTPAYMAPELFTEEGVPSVASDLWSFGIVLFELVTGKPPFLANTFVELSEMIQRDPVKFPQGLGEHLVSLLQGLLMKDPAKRISWGTILTHKFWQGVPMPNLAAIPINHVYQDYLVFRKSISGMERTGKRLPPGITEKSRLDISDQDEVFDFAKRPQTPLGDPEVEDELDEHGGEELVVKEKLDTMIKELEELNLSDVLNEGSIKDSHSGRPNSAPFSKPSSIEALQLRPMSADTSNYSQASPLSVAHTRHSHPRFSQHRTSVHEAAAAALELPLAPEDEEANGIEEAVEGDFVEKASFLAPPSDYGAPLSLDDSSLAKMQAYKRSFWGNLVEGEIQVLTPDFFNVKQGNFVDLLEEFNVPMVRPIVGSPSSAALPTLKYSPRMLPFENISSDQAASLSVGALQSFLSRAFHALLPVQNTPSQIVHALGYLYSLCTNARLANVIVSSSLVALLIRLGVKAEGSGTLQLEHHSYPRTPPRSPEAYHASRTPRTPPTPPGSTESLKSPTESKVRRLRVRVAIILAVLVRHATYIAPRLNDEGLLDAFISFAQDEVLAVRRYGIAGLGELLFYIVANAPENSSESSPWKISGSALKQIQSSLTSHDGVVRYYGIRTFENILGESSHPQSARFATVGTAKQLLELSSMEKSDNSRSSAAMALAHLVRVNRRMMPRLAESNGWGFLSSGFQAVHGSPKTQQAYLSILNLVLVGDIGAAERTTREALFGTRSDVKEPMLKGLLQLMSHGQTLSIRSNAMLTIAMFLRHFPDDVEILIRNKIFFILDRMYIRVQNRAGFEDTRPLRRSLLELVHVFSEDIILPISNEIIKAASRLNSVVAGGRVIHASSPEAGVLQKLGSKTLPLLIQLNGSHALSKYVSRNPDLIVALGFLMRLTLNTAEDASPLFRKFILQAVESVAQEVISSENEEEVGPVVLFALQHFVPPSWACSRASHNVESQAASLRISGDLLSGFLMSVPEVTRDFMVNHVLAFSLDLLSEEAAPLPNMMASLLCFAVTRQPDLVREMMTQDLITPLICFLPQSEEDEGSLPVMVAMKLVSCLLLAGTSQLDVAELVQPPAEILHRTMNGLSKLLKSLSNNDDDEETLDFCLDLLLPLLKMLPNSLPMFGSLDLKPVASVLAIGMQRAIDQEEFTSRRIEKLSACLHLTCQKLGLISEEECFWTLTAKIVKGCFDVLKKVDDGPLTTSTQASIIHVLETYAARKKLNDDVKSVIEEIVKENARATEKILEIKALARRIWEEL